MNEYPALDCRQLAHIEHLDWHSLVPHWNAVRRERFLAIADPLHGSKDLFDVIPETPGMRRR
jgi:hypothetical protein